MPQPFLLSGRVKSAISLREGAGLGIAAATLAGSFVPPVLVARHVNSEAAKLPSLDPSGQKNVLDDMGAKAPLVPIADAVSDSGYWRGNRTELRQFLSDHPNSSSLAKPDRARALRSGPRQGFILTAPRSPRGIVAHEGGHALIDAEGGLGRANQRYGRPISGVGLGASMFAGMMAGALTGRPLVGAGVGLGAGALTGVPTLVNEWQATRRAQEHLDQSGLSPEQIAAERKVLDKAYLTYLYTHTMMPALMGAGLGLSSRVMRPKTPAASHAQRAKHAADGSAAGIPDRSDFGDPASVRPGSLLDWIVQRHEARRAGTHYDVRFGGEDTGLYSWAVRKGLPQPGQKHLAVQQPLHASSYQGFEGEIPSGYGAGKVTKHDQGKVLVTKAGPEGVHFSTAHRRFPERYALVPYPKAGERHWLMLNSTKTDPIPYQKRRYVKIPADQAESVLENLTPGSSVQEKLDGAASLTKLYQDHAEVASYRAQKGTGAPIVHTERLAGGRIPVRVPRELAGSVLRGELYGVAGDGTAIRPQHLGGLLNSGIAKSLDDQRARRVRLKNMVFDLQQHGSTPVADRSYQERRAKLQEIMKHLPPELFHTPAEATTPQDALAMWRGVKGGTNPLTREGVVIHPPEGPPQKIKLTDDHDVHVRGFFPGKGKYQGVGVGGFTYSHTPDGPVAGEVGSGLTDETRRMMHEDPDSFLGRVAKVRAQEKLPSGALRAPSLLSLHEDYPLAKQAAGGALRELGFLKNSEAARKTCYARSYYLLGASENGGGGQATPQESSASSTPSTLDNNDCLNPDCNPTHQKLASAVLRELGVTRNDTRSYRDSQGGCSGFAKEARKAKQKRAPEAPTSPPELQLVGPSTYVPGRDTSGTEFPENSDSSVKPEAYSGVGELVGGTDGQAGVPPTPVSSTPPTELAAQPIEPRLSIGQSVRRSQGSPSPLQRLLEAKAHSDARRYAAKHSIMRSLITERPGEFAIDSEDRGVVGLTHAPTGFRMHLPRTAVPAPIRRLEGASA